MKQENKQEIERCKVFERLRKVSFNDSKTYQEALYDYAPGYECPKDTVSIDRQSEVTEVKAPVSERQSILSSLKNFAQKQLEDSKEGIVKFQGGEIVHNNSNNLSTNIDEVSHVIKIKKIDEISSECSSCVGQLQSSIKSKSIIHNLEYFQAHPPKILAIGENLCGDGNEESFSLFAKMMEAMKVSTSEFTYCNLSYCQFKRNDCHQNVFDEIIKIKPKVILSFGAVSTNILLNRKEKLSAIHGKEFLIRLEKEVESHELSHYAIFHPSYLIINPGMKKTAWDDLKKVKGKLGQ